MFASLVLPTLLFCSSVSAGPLYKRWNASCPVVETGILNFDDLSGSETFLDGETYHGFYFSGDPAEWIVGPSSPGPVSQPNAISIGDQSTAFLDSGNSSQTFDILSFYITGLAIDDTGVVPLNTTDIDIKMKGTHVDGTSTEVDFTLKNARAGGKPQFMSFDTQWQSLTSLYILATSKSASGKTVVQDAVLDDIKYQKRVKC